MPQEPLTGSREWDGGVEQKKPAKSLSWALAGSVLLRQFGRCDSSLVGKGRPCVMRARGDSGTA